jgi:hypothetical protein
VLQEKARWMVVCEARGDVAPCSRSSRGLGVAVYARIGEGKDSSQIISVLYNSSLRLGRPRTYATVAKETMQHHGPFFPPPPPRPISFPPLLNTRKHPGNHDPLSTPCTVLLKRILNHNLPEISLREGGAEDGQDPTHDQVEPSCCEVG